MMGRYRYAARGSWVVVLAGLSVLTMVSSCVHAGSGSAFQTITLTVGQTRHLSGGRTITFVKVINDSRCPSGAVCIWQGDAALQIAVDDKQGRQLHVLHTAGGKQYHRTLAINGLVLTVKTLQPRPPAGTQLMAGDYRLTLRINE